ncbi:exodeoxyribonuclease III [Uliginosibacterium sp. sgz301328]|uniref:exodeoxyribonuclease III n=1 Tax=Uliginosibacterium sp. sgz301328 TaxID=3243764 RepID=UPI00359F09FD
MLRVISLNLNGIRSAATKGFFPWLQAQNADVVCLQEVKAQMADLTPEMQNPQGFAGHFYCAEKKGYSGVAIYSRLPTQGVTCGVEHVDYDTEGRFIKADIDLPDMALSVVSLYLPSGSSSEERQLVKFAFMDHFLPRLAELHRSGREVIVCGDWNIAHKEIDLKNWKSNQKNSGFLPEERAWLTRVIDELGWVDVYRRLHPATTDESYTWWSNRGQAWAKNVGWRLDYQFATPGIAARAHATSIFKEQRFSDHAPLIVDYDVATA